MPIVKRVTRQDVERVLLRVEQTIGPDEANLLRAHVSMLESQLRTYQLGDDFREYSDDEHDPEGAIAWQGALR